jgi:hypothetical protein
MGWLRKSARALGVAGLALTSGSAFAVDGAPPPAPAPAYTYAPGCVDPGYGYAAGPGCASGQCNNGYGNGNPANFAPNKPFHKNGCQPYCATKTYPHSDWHYIKHYCGPSLIPGSCYGHFNTTWRRWEDVCPQWQPNNDVVCGAQGCAAPLGCPPGALNSYPGETYISPTPEVQPIPAAPAPAPAPTPLPTPAPVPAPMPMPMPVAPKGLSLTPVAPSQVIVVQATPLELPAPIHTRPASHRVEQGAILRNALAAPSLLPPPEVEEIVVPTLR